MQKPPMEKKLIAVVEKYTPHVVVTDIAMPELNGIEASRLIKKSFPQDGYDRIVYIRQPGVHLQNAEGGNQ